MNNVVINADDFGLNSSVNRAIVELFERGLVQSTTLMANMPGFDEAVEMAHQEHLTGKIGIHLVLTEGTPLTEDMRSANFLFHGKADFKQTLKNNLFFLDRRKQELIFNELAAQIEKIRSCGIPISHIDTHHHVHEWYSVTKIIFDLMKKYSITSVRILNNMEQDKPLSKKLYRGGVNYVLRRRGLNFSELFGSYDDYRAVLKGRPGSLANKKVEVMVHPDYDSEGRLVDKVESSRANLFTEQMVELNNSDSQK